MPIFAENNNRYNMNTLSISSPAPAATLAAGLPVVLDTFLLSQDVKESSRALYRRTLHQFFSWVSRKGYQVSELARPQLIEFKEDLQREGKSSLTIGSYLTAVRKFYTWTEAEKVYPNIAKAIKTPRRKQQFRKQPLSPAQASSLLLSVSQTGTLRDYALITLLLRTGLRTIEVVRANVEDLCIKGGQRVLMIQGKGRDEKDNFVILSEKAYRPLAAYLEERGSSALPSSPLFVSTSHNNQGERLTTRTISFIAKEALKGIGLNDKAYTAHSLRHTTGVSILRAGGSLRDAQLTLRHSNPATTQIYVSTLDEEVRLKNAGELRIDNLF